MLLGTRVRVCGRADDEPVRNIDADGDARVIDGDADGLGAARDGAQAARGAGDFQARIEGLARVGPGLQRAVGLRERRDRGFEAFERRHRKSIGPDLLPAHDEQRRPAQPRIASHAPEQLVALTFDLGLADQQNFGIDLAQLGEAQIGRCQIGHDHRHAARAQLLSHAVGSTRVVVGQRHAHTGDADSLWISVGRRWIEQA